MPKISVITPASRGVKCLTHLINDFKNQTFQDFEHLIVWDGKVPVEVASFTNIHKNDYNIRLMNVEKDLGNMNQSPGTNPRNHGIQHSQGEYLVFADDDDRYKSSYLEKLLTSTGENHITVVQMSCTESRIYKNGNPNRIILVPEMGLPTFPIICHVGTPCFIVKRKWAIAEPWRHEPEHDFRFIKRICEKYNPVVHIVGGMQVDVDSAVIKNMKDWVTFPPFYRQ
jgi:glycosyltransferase involved in cell wall biosynthesis